MLRLSLLVIISCLLLASSASATEVAELLYYKTPYAKKAGGNKRGVVLNTLHSGKRARLLILGEKTVNDRLWLRVRLPSRPNGSKGWIRAERTYRHRLIHRIVVDRSARTLYLFRNNRLWKKSRIVVGAAATPTPLGKFAIWDRYRPGANSSLRPWVLEITAHSEKLRRYEGGEGRVALHGMRDELKVPLGSAASHGCMRLPDWLINLLARKMSLGTPVTVRR